MNDPPQTNATTDLRSQAPNSIGSRGRSLRTVSHVLGVFSLTWSLVAWAEWLLIPLLYRDDGSPVPYLAFAPQAILLFLGCVGVLILIPLVAIAVRRSWMLLYAVPAAVFVAFQVGQFAVEVLL